jgi:hypothetical protein
LLGAFWNWKHGMYNWMHAQFAKVCKYLSVNVACIYILGGRQSNNAADLL